MLHPDPANIDWDGLVWETVPCPLCGKWEEEEILSVPAPGGRADYRLVRCRRCYLGYLNPRPDEQSIGQFYQDDYLCYDTGVDGSGPQPQGIRERLKHLVMSRYFGVPPELHNRWEKWLAWAASWWFYPRPTSLMGIPYQGEGDLLDYGCGSGWYAYRMQQLNWKATGMDFSPHATTRVQRHFGLPTCTGRLPHRKIAKESFDVVTMRMVLEHVHDPHQLLAAVAEVLRPQGCLLISVPNLDSWGFENFGKHWYGLHLPHHTLHFTPQSIRQLLEMHGFEVRTLDKASRPGWVRRSLQTARRSGDSDIQNRWLVRLHRSRLASSLLARYTSWIDKPDQLMVLAYRTSCRSMAMAA